MIIAVLYVPDKARTIIHTDPHRHKHWVGQIFMETDLIGRRSGGGGQNNGDG